MSADALQTFYKYLPAAAAQYCYDLWQQYAFHFKIDKKRSTKLGDWRYEPARDKHTITVNHDLNPYQFLVTYIHEVAHLVTFESFQNRVKPHGREWKDNFKSLLKPLIIPSIFPPDLIQVLESYLRNPRASSCADPHLFQAMSLYDQKREGEMLLSEIDPGGVFQFNDKLFQKEEKKRTRSVCLELRTGKKYLIPEIATVTIK